MIDAAKYKGRAAYVASAGGNAQEAREVAAALRAAGARVTSTWHDVDGIESARRGEHRLTASARLDVAATCMAEVRAADAFVLVAHPDMRGSLVEFGAAYAYGLEIAWVGPRDATLFSELATAKVLNVVEEIHGVAMGLSREMSGEGSRG